MSYPFQSDSIVAKKAYAFALEVIVMYKFLVTEKKEYVLSKQLLRSGTSIGANINEAIIILTTKEKYFSSIGDTNS